MRPDRGVLGFAHRGARAECRDNTLASFARALELGATALESDVWLTADGVAVLDHDGVVRVGLRRVAIGRVPVSALPGHIPTLAALLDLAGGGIDVSLDVKDPQAVATVVEAAGARRCEGRVWLCGTGPDLRAWRRLSERVRLVDSTRRGSVGDLAAHAAGLARAGVDAVNLPWREWDAEAVSAVQGAGLAAFGWGIQRRADLDAALDLGLDGVYSDHVERMTAAIAARGR